MFRSCCRPLSWRPGAAPAPHKDPVADAPEAQRIGAFERPEALVAGASRRLADTIGEADVGQDFGVSEARVPYADTYWPFILGGANAVWNPRGRNPRPPVEKYMLITNPYQLADAQAWEFQYHGPAEPGVTTWHGHCPGWSAAATTNAPILHPVFAGADGRGGIVACREGQPGCVRFEIGDVNALMAEIYLDGPYSLIGSTCNTPAFAIPRDMFGRVLVKGCDGVNAGSLLVAAATLLKQYRVPFTIDLQKPSTTEQIWNQPTYLYHVYDYHPITRAAAANLVEHGSTQARRPSTGGTPPRAGSPSSTWACASWASTAPTCSRSRGRNPPTSCASRRSSSSTPTPAIPAPSSSAASTSISPPRTPTG